MPSLSAKTKRRGGTRYVSLSVAVSSESSRRRVMLLACIAVSLSGPCLAAWLATRPINLGDPEEDAAYAADLAEAQAVQDAWERAQPRFNFDPP